MTKHASFPTACAFFFAVTLGGGALAKDFEVEIRGFSDDVGQVVVQLFASQTNYEARVPDLVVTAPISARVATVRIRGLNGTYAISAHHSRDSDRAFATLPFGVPLEPVGYSQGVWNGISRPDWALASFSSDIEPPKQLIRLRTNAVVAFAQMLAVGLPALLAVFAGLAIVRWTRAILAKPAPSKEISLDRQ